MELVMGKEREALPPYYWVEVFRMYRTLVTPLLTDMHISQRLIFSRLVVVLLISIKVIAVESRNNVHIGDMAFVCSIGMTFLGDYL